MTNSHPVEIRTRNHLQLRRRHFPKSHLAAHYATPPLLCHCLESVDVAQMVDGIALVRAIALLGTVVQVHVQDVTKIQRGKNL
jgi:hypothetical protein